MIALGMASSKLVILPLEMSEPSGGAGLFSGRAVIRLRTLMPDATIHTLGEILENPSSILYRVELPNGKVILAHLSKTLSESQTVFAAGQRVILELTPYDFDQARILGEAE